MATERKPRKDRTSLVISAVLHIIIILGVGYWMHTTGKLEMIKDTILKLAQGDKKEQSEKQIKAVQPKAQPQRQAPLPKINEGVPPPPSSGGTRRAVSSDAPDAVGGGTFFADTRAQGDGPSTGGKGGAPTQVSTSAPPKIIVAPAPVAPPKPSFGPPPKATIKQLLMERAKEAASTEAVGTEQIAKSGSSDAGAIVNKVSGAAIVDGKFAVIRGLSDRYVTTTFNGGEIPSADPYRRSASLDLFPAQVIDRVVVAKTFTPDQQGAFTGGGINIVSKSFPDRPFTSMSLGGAYNTQATGNPDFLTYKGGATDWLGMDDGSRAIPSPLDDLQVKIPPPVSTTGPNNPNNPAYRDRIAQAELLDDYTKLLGTTQFSPYKQAQPMNHNMSLAFGDTTHLFGRPFGVFGSYSYKHDYSFHDQGIARRYVPAGGGNFTVNKDNTEVLAQSVVNWAGMVSLASQWHPDHEIAFNYLFNQNGVDYVRQQEGTQETDPGALIYQNRLQLTERNLQTFQLKGVDKFPGLAEARLDWLAGLSLTSQDEPDVRFFNYRYDGGEYSVGLASIPDPKEPTRYWRELDEQNKNLKIDLTLPFRQWTDQEASFKAGVFSSLSERTFTERQVYYPDTIGFDGNPNNYLRADNLGYIRPPNTNRNTGRIAYSWMRYIGAFDSKYDATSDIQAIYAMLDLPVVGKLRLVGGARIETTLLSVDSYSDIAIGGRRDNSSLLDQMDVLPAVGLIYALRTNMNVRLHYSHTIARPSFRELAGYRSYDPVLDVLLDGNPALKLSAAKNYDLRWEWFPRPGEIYSVSFYYKQLENAIERIASDNLADSVTFINRPKATVMGVELEARKALDFLHFDLRHFSIGGNFSYIQSKTELFPYEFANKQIYLPNAESTRALYDQSPYIMNADLSYDNPRSGTSASLILSAAGPRIAIASPIAEDVYEHPPLSLDFVIGQKIGRRASIRFRAQNLLNPEIKRTYGKQANGEEFIYSSYKRGITLGLSFGYDF